MRTTTSKFSQKKVFAERALILVPIFWEGQVAWGKGKGREEVTFSAFRKADNHKHFLSRQREIRYSAMEEGILKGGIEYEQK